MEHVLSNSAPTALPRYSPVFLAGFSSVSVAWLVPAEPVGTPALWRRSRIRDRQRGKLFMPLLPRRNRITRRAEISAKNEGARGRGGGGRGVLKSVILREESLLRPRCSPADTPRRLSGKTSRFHEQERVQRPGALPNLCPFAEHLSNALARSGETGSARCSPFPPSRVRVPRRRCPYVCSPPVCPPAPFWKRMQPPSNQPINIRP